MICQRLIQLGVPRRPANALNIEVGQPLDRCRMKTPEHWGDADPEAARWLLSGGSPLVLGICTPNGCPHKRSPDGVLTNMEHEKTERAAQRFAEAAHGAQKYGEAPYVTHLAAVRAVLGDFGFSGDLAVAAWLHDTLEDTQTTADSLELAFGSTVTKLVWAVTGVGKNRKERNECAYGRMEQECPRAVILKLADRIANAEACAKTRDHRLEMYRKEYPGFKARLARLGKLLDEEPTVAAMWVRLDKILG